MDCKLRNTYFASILLGLLTFGLTLTFLSLKRAARADDCSGACKCVAMHPATNNDNYGCNPGTKSIVNNVCVYTANAGGACPKTKDDPMERGTVECPNPSTEILSECCPPIEPGGVPGDVTRMP